jgi:hypothetical protein
VALLSIEPVHPLARVSGHQRAYALSSRLSWCCVPSRTGCVLAVTDTDVLRVADG